MGAFHSSSKIPTISNQEQMVRKFFSGEVSRKSGNCRISEKRTIQPKIQERKSNGREISGKKCPKLWAYLARFFSFPEILENAFPFVTRNFRQLKAEDSLNTKRPTFTT